MILILSSSLKSDSNSRVLAREAQRALEHDGQAATLLDLREFPLPLCDGGTAYSHPNVARVGEEAASLAAALEALRGAPDATAGFAERSRIFRDRGLAGDSSVLTQFAVDRGLCGLRERAVLPAGSVSRVAIVGPGLDFADKQEGFDFYPPQSLQPFTVMDSLFRCELAPRSSLRVTTLDISPRVNAHLRAAASRGAYRFVLPWPTDTANTQPDGLDCANRLTRLTRQADRWHPPLESDV